MTKKLIRMVVGASFVAAAAVGMTAPTQGPSGASAESVTAGAQGDPSWTMAPAGFAASSHAASAGSVDV